jgi:LacI family transcriptional regulator
LRAKISDIAKIAGLSTASISRVLNNQGGYSKETAKRVMKIANDLGYFKDRSASDLARRSNNTIGVIYTDFETNFNDLVIKNIMIEAKKRHLDVILMIAQQNDPDGLTKIVRDMIERRVFAVQFISTHPSPQIIQMLNRAAIFPQVIGDATDHTVSYVSSDDAAIGYKATTYLIEKGHRRIGFVSPNVMTDYVSHLRFSGYRKALKEHGISFKPDWLFEETYSYQTGIHATAHYQKYGDIDAVIGVSDEVSWGLLNGFYDLNVNVPGDIALISIDGTALCLQTRPRLTSVTQDFALMGKTAIKQLAPKKADPHRITTVTIPFRIDIRETS